MTEFKDKVYETSESTGTGSMTLDGTTLRNQTFNQAYNTGDIVSYAIQNTVANEWEVGKGSFAPPNTLTRDTVEDGSNGPGNAVNFTAGTKDVFSVVSATDLRQFIQTGGDILTGDLNYNNNTQTNAVIDNTNIITVIDTNFTIQDDLNNSKQVQFNAASIPSGTTRNYVFPNVGGTFALNDQDQSFQGTQTFTGTIDVTGAIDVKDGGFTIYDSGDATAGAVFDTANISSNNTHTYTFQDASGTIAHTDTTQTVTGDNTFSGAVDFTGNVNAQSANVTADDFTVNDTGLVVRNFTDNTKQAKFDSSGITPTTTRTYTFQDTDGTVAHTDTDQTVSGNNTYTGDATFNGDVNAESGTFTVGTVRLTEGVTQPTPNSAFASLFVDSSDGSLKIVFGDGTVKTIVTDS